MVSAPLRHHGAARGPHAGKEIVLIDGTILEKLAPNAPDPILLSDAYHLEWVQTAAGTIEATEAGRAELMALDAEAEPAVPIAVRLALKLAASRTALGEVRDPFHLSVVFAVFKEHTRILRPEEHPHGEDFLRRKIGQLEWLFERSPRHTWDLTVVDDGCPEGSGELARAILAERPDVDARVLFLADAIARGVPVTRGLGSADESRKGGSIRYGMWETTRRRRRNHVILFTDADLSTHLAQAGLLVDAILREGRSSAIGSRRHPASVVRKEGSRDSRGRLFIYLWKRLIPQLGGITDTQCGFKAFLAADLRSWIGDMKENGFAFDIEMLLRTALARPGSIAVTPVAWIDSDAASTTTGLQPYPEMLRSVVRLYREILPPDPAVEAFVAMIESLSDEQFQRVLERVPAAIAERDPSEFDEFSDVSAADLAGLAAP